MIDLVLPALICALTLTIVSGPLGCFIVWRKMAYFGDTVAHASLLGVCIGLLLEINTSYSVLFVCIALTFLVGYFSARKLSTDTTLGIFAHGSLALGLLLVTAINYKRVNLQSILMGDILTVNYLDVTIFACAAAAIMALLVRFWKRLLLSAIDEDIAQVEGYSQTTNRLLLMMLITVTIALSINLVGVLLISALLIIPAAAARNLARSPEAMAIVAALIGAFAATVGIVISIFVNAPVGPAIVTSALSVFILSQVLAKQS